MVADAGGLLREVVILGVIVERRRRDQAAASHPPDPLFDRVDGPVRPVAPMQGAVSADAKTGEVLKQDGEVHRLEAYRLVCAGVYHSS